MYYAFIVKDANNCSHFNVYEHDMYYAYNYWPLNIDEHDTFHEQLS